MYSPHSESPHTICPHLPSQLYLFVCPGTPALPESVSHIATNQNHCLAQKSSRTSISVKICIWQLETEPRNNSGLSKIKVYFSFLQRNSGDKQCGAGVASPIVPVSFCFTMHLLSLGTKGTSSSCIHLIYLLGRQKGTDRQM